MGCMSFGDKSHPRALAWARDKDEGRALIKRALELGINFFDTANVYSAGTSEEVTGAALRELANRDEYVLATKVYFPMHDGPNGAGLSRKSIMTQVDASLKRLGTDYIDLYIIHRWDYNTPIEETMQALNDIVRAGKVRYIGASAMYAWQFQKALHVSDKLGLARFVSMQNHYNLMYREEEREMMPLCLDYGIASTPYSPYAGGRLVRVGESQRDALDAVARMKYDHAMQQDEEIIRRVAEVAERLGISRAEVAMAWLLQKPAVTSPIIGPTKVEQIEGAVNALNTKLSESDMQYLEEPYTPHKVIGAL